MIRRREGVSVQGSHVTDNKVGKALAPWPVPADAPFAGLLGSATPSPCNSTRYGTGRGVCLSTASALPYGSRLCVCRHEFVQENAVLCTCMSSFGEKQERFIDTGQIGYPVFLGSCYPFFGVFFGLFLRLRPSHHALSTPAISSAEPVSGHG